MKLPNRSEGSVALLSLEGGGEDVSLLAFVRRLSSAKSLEEIMAIASQAVRASLRADGATFVLRDADRCHYADEDAVSPLWKGRRFPMRACISGWCMMNRQTVAIADIYEDPRIPADAYRPTFVKSLAMVPVGRDAPVAALGAYWSEKRQPQPEELMRLQTIADAAAVAAASVRQRAAPAGPPASTPREERVPPPPRSALGRFSFRACAALVRRHGERSLEAYGFAVLCVVVATLVRLAAKATGVHGLVIYSTYYPATVAAILVGGRRAGALAAVLGGLAAYSFFMPPLYAFVSVTVSDVLNVALYAGSCGLIIVVIDRYERAVSRLREEDARHLTIAREEHHRLKNAMFVAQCIVKQSLSDMPERARTISQRLWASQQEIGDRVDNRAVTLRDLLMAELQAYDLTKFSLELEDGRELSHKAGSILSLAVHELTTNALKYGALSTPNGRVSVASRNVGGRMSLRWRETGGPPVQPPKRRGYGTVLLRRIVEGAGGVLAVDYSPSGVTAEISLAV
ncbi:MAG: DUF4118 domain-containing protein [Caulobacteraceae bacterium]|nr:DUF4118 domain-containing protein [Caulobacteraceae bacterium]